MFSRILTAFLFFSIFLTTYSDAKQRKLLVVLTGASELKLKNGEVYKTGYWLEEFSVPYQLFEKNNFQITIATPTGNRPTVDHGSASTDEKGKPLYWKTIEELNEALSIKKRVLDEGQIVALKDISNKELKTFDAIFFPGGHGPMADMISNKDVARVLSHFHNHKKPTALVCHAPAVLTSSGVGNFLYKGYKVTAFTDAEESQTPVGPKMLNTPQGLLKKAGANFVEAPAWQPHVVEDRELITGQNPASSKTIAEVLVKRLLSN